MERLPTLMIDGAMMLLMYVTIVGLILCDLRAGIRKARQRGDLVTSEGRKRTIDKIARYFNMTFAMSLIDVVQLALIFFLYHFYKTDLWMVPWATLFATGYVAWVEIHSIWEPADVKERKLQQDYLRALESLIRHYGSAEQVINLIKTKDNESRTIEQSQQD